MAPILQLRALKAFYGQSEVVHGIDVDVEEGGMTVLLGANGAGKTTTLRAICGTVRSEGEILFAGERLDRRTTEQIADRKSTRLNSSHRMPSRMPSSA